MASPLAESSLQAQLRLDAEARIQRGLAPASQGWTPGAEALTLLYGLASDPSSAGDALKLLHELQVHQVELDLQHEQMQHNQHELEGELSRYRALYESAPAAYFVVNPEGKVTEGNHAGLRLMGVAPEHLAGCLLERLAAPEHRPAVAGLLQRTGPGAMTGRCTVRAAGAPDGAARGLCLLARVTPGIAGWLVLAIEADEPRSLPARQN